MIFGPNEPVEEEIDTIPCPPPAVEEIDWSGLTDDDDEDTGRLQ